MSADEVAQAYAVAAERTVATIIQTVPAVYAMQVCLALAEQMDEAAEHTGTRDAWGPPSRFIAAAARGCAEALAKGQADMLAAAGAVRTE